MQMKERDSVQKSWQWKNIQVSSADSTAQESIFEQIFPNLINTMKILQTFSSRSNEAENFGWFRDFCSMTIISCLIC